FIITSFSTSMSLFFLHYALPIFVVSSSTWSTTDSIWMELAPVGLTGRLGNFRESCVWKTNRSSRLFRAANSMAIRCWSATLSDRSEEHTSELQSRENLVCRLLLE